MTTTQAGIMNQAMAQAVSTTTKTVTNTVDTWDAIINASFVVQLTLVALIIMSAVSWAIIFNKKKQFKAATESNKKFTDAFWKTDSLENLYKSLGEYKESSLAPIFKSGYMELQRMVEAQEKPDENKLDKLIGIDNVERSLTGAVDEEIGRLESQLSFLATTGSTGPFIGLFGTVWGIMGSFQKIGVMKSASLAVVAPGISEALVATAIGLAAAIPAVIGYNHLINQLRRQEIAMNHFAADYLNILKRNFFKGQ